MALPLLCLQALPFVARPHSQDGDGAAGSASAQTIYDRVSRRCVKGDGFCQDYAELDCLRLLEHGKDDPHGTAEEGTPTGGDRMRVGRLRQRIVEWMRKQTHEDFANADMYLASDAYVKGTFRGLNKQYGNSKTLTGAASVLGVDIVSLTETKLKEMTLSMFKQEGKECKESAEDIVHRIEHPTDTPLLVVIHNGNTSELGGHYAAGGVYMTGSWTPPTWLVDDSATGGAMQVCGTAF